MDRAGLRALSRSPARSIISISLDDVEAEIPDERRDRGARGAVLMQNCKWDQEQDPGTGLGRWAVAWTSASRILPAER